MREALRSALRDWRALVAHGRLWDLAGERLGRDLQAVIRYEIDHDEPPRTVERTEEAYGQDGSFGLGEGEARVLITGRIDRIDTVSQTDSGRLQFIVLDYKRSDGPPRAAIEQGWDFQLPLYCLAAQHIPFGRPAEPLKWAYYRVTRPVGWRNAVEAPAIPALLSRAEEHIVQHAAAIRSGMFPVQPQGDACRWCDFDCICRYSRTRTERKGQPDRVGASVP
jgi:RecB family exonuclease